MVFPYSKDTLSPNQSDPSPPEIPEDPITTPAPITLSPAPLAPNGVPATNTCSWLYLGTREILDHAEEQGLVSPSLSALLTRPSMTVSEFLFDMFQECPTAYYCPVSATSTPNGTTLGEFDDGEAWRSGLPTGLPCDPEQVPDYSKYLKIRSSSVQKVSYTISRNE